MPRSTHRQITFMSVPMLAMALCGCMVVVQIPLEQQQASPPSGPTPASADCPLPERAGAEASEVLALLNQHRARADLPALQPARGLTLAAQGFACDLAAQGRISHVGSDGSSLADRLRRSGAQASLMAENVAAGQRSAAEVVSAWMASPHHRDNVLRSGVTWMGLGLADGAMPVWVLDLSS